MTPAQFLKHLYRDAVGFSEIRLIHKSGDWKQAKKIYRHSSTIHTGDFDYLAELNADYHIYHRVAISTEQRSRKQDICAITALWLDIDGDSDEYLQRLEDMYYPPTTIVFSGGGFHAYWLLKEPLWIPDDKTRFEVERTMQGMILAYGEGADEKTKDITRILRTPGFYNIKDKYETPPLCEVVYFDEGDGDRYHFKWFHKRYAPLGAPKQPPVKRHIPRAAYSNELPVYTHWYLYNTVSEGNRNKALYTAARGYLDAGKSQFEAEQDLISKARADGLTQSEAISTINSAFRNSPNQNVNPKMKSRYALGDMTSGGAL